MRHTRYRTIQDSGNLEIARQSRKFNPRVNAELRKRVPEMAADSVRRREEALGDLRVGQATHPNQMTRSGGAVPWIGVNRGRRAGNCDQAGVQSADCFCWLNALDMALRSQI